GRRFGPVRPSRGPVLWRARSHLEPADPAPRAARPRTALPTARVDRPAHRARPPRPRRAPLLLPRPRRRAAAGPRLVGRGRDLDLRRIIDLRPAVGDDVRGDL